MMLQSPESADTDLILVQIHLQTRVGIHSRVNTTYLFQNMGPSVKNCMCYLSKTQK